MIDTKLFTHLADRSTRLSYDVRKEFDWQDDLSRDVFWLPENLLSVYGTNYATSCDIETLKKLSHQETIGLFRLFVKGESDLLQTILDIMVREEFSEGFDYFSHFVEEENQHMWFFAEFCRRYGGKDMPVKILKFQSQFPPAVERFLSISRIFLFEEMGDWFNVRAMNDDRLPELVRHIHRRHHLDEAGHIAAGWSVAENMWNRLTETERPDVLESAINNLSSFIDWSLQNLYNPEAYRRAGFDNVYEMRQELIEDPEREKVHSDIFSKSRKKFEKILGPEYGSIITVKGK